MADTVSGGFDTEQMDDAERLAAIIQSLRMDGNPEIATGKLWPGTNVPWSAADAWASGHEFFSEKRRSGDHWLRDRLNKVKHFAKLSSPRGCGKSLEFHALREMLNRSVDGQEIGILIEATSLDARLCQLQTSTAFSQITDPASQRFLENRVIALAFLETVLSEFQSALAQRNYRAIRSKKANLDALEAALAKVTEYSNAAIPDSADLQIEMTGYRELRAARGTDRRVDEQHGRVAGNAAFSLNKVFGLVGVEVGIGGGGGRNVQRNRAQEAETTREDMIVYVARPDLVLDKLFAVLREQRRKEDFEFFLFIDDFSEVSDRNRALLGRWFAEALPKFVKRRVACYSWEEHADQIRGTWPSYPAVAGAFPEQFQTTAEKIAFAGAHIKAILLNRLNFYRVSKLQTYFDTSSSDHLETPSWMKARKNLTINEEKYFGALALVCGGSIRALGEILQIASGLDDWPFSIESLLRASRSYWQTNLHTAIDSVGRVHDGYVDAKGYISAIVNKLEVLLFDWCEEGRGEGDGAPLVQGFFCLNEQQVPMLTRLIHCGVLLPWFIGNAVNKTLVLPNPAWFMTIDPSHEFYWPTEPKRSKNIRQSEAIAATALAGSLGLQH